MQQRHCLLWILLILMLNISCAQKKIFFTKLQCLLRSNKLLHIDCTLENSNDLSVEFTTGKSELPNFASISDLKLNILYSNYNNVMRFNRYRMDICNIFSGSRPSLLTMLQKGIQQTDNNLPKKCPFKRNTTYALRHMNFDGNYLPAYFPEYNFTYSGKFQTNKESLFQVRAEGALCDINNVDCIGTGSSEVTK